MNPTDAPVAAMDAPKRSVATMNPTDAPVAAVDALQAVSQIQIGNSGISNTDG
jgi:hypothetical protein